MTFGPSNALNAFVSQNQIFSEDEDQRIIQHTTSTNNMARNINLREIASYQTTEIVTGQQFFTAGNPQQNRFAYRTVVNFGALPNAATKSVAHGIVGIDPGGGANSTFTFTRIYGTANNQAAGAEIFFPIPYYDPTLPNNGVGVYVDPVNVNVVTAINLTAYFAVIVLEYLKN